MAFKISNWWKKEVPVENSTGTSFVRMARVELAQENSHYPLKVARLPFRHIRL